ncbi:hypothetical protein [Larkinella arboricola]
MTSCLITCKMGKTVADANVSELNALINEIVSLLGVKVTAEDKQEHLKGLVTLIKWIKRKYAHYTLEEIQLAYELLIARELDIAPFRAIDASYFSDTMAAYKRYRENNTELREVYRNQLHLPPANTEKTQAEIAAQMEGYLAEALEVVRNGGEYPDTGNGLYDWLDKQGRIPYTNAEKYEFVKQAEPLVRANLTTDLANTSDQWTRRSLSALIKASMHNNADMAARVRAYAKYLAVNHYLKSLLNNAS